MFIFSSCSASSNFCEIKMYRIRSKFVAVLISILQNIFHQTLHSINKINEPRHEISQIILYTCTCKENNIIFHILPQISVSISLIPRHLAAGHKMAMQWVWSHLATALSRPTDKCMVLTMYFSSHDALTHFHELDNVLGELFVLNPFTGNYRLSSIFLRLTQTQRYSPPSTKLHVNTVGLQVEV